MFLFQFLLSLFLAFLLTAIYMLGFKRKAACVGIGALFLIIFLVTWAGGVWLTPFGNPMWGVYWWPFLFTAIFITLLLAAAAPGRPPRSAAEAKSKAPETKRQEASGVVLSVFFWLLVILLIAAIVVYYAGGYWK